MSEKQDRQGARTTAQLEQKYGFGSRFAEILGIATDAQTEVRQLDSGLDQEEIMNRLTKYGAAQGIYRTDEGEIFMNAEYIQTGKLNADRIDVDALYARDILMTGTFTGSASVYIPPTWEDLQLMFDVYTGTKNQPSGTYFDLNSDGSFDLEDIQLAYQVFAGKILLSSCRGAKKKTVNVRIKPSDPERTVYIYGKNQWGSTVESYIGIDNTSSCFATRDYLNSVITTDDTMAGTLHRTLLDTAEKEYFNPPMKKDVEYRTIERWAEKPVYTQIRAASTVSSLGYSIIRKSETVSVNGTACVQVWYIK